MLQPEQHRTVHKEAVARIPAGLIAKHGPLVTHGTSATAAEAIRRTGFRPSGEGILGGGGVYVGQDVVQANRYATPGEMVRHLGSSGNTQVRTKTPGKVLFLGAPREMRDSTVMGGQGAEGLVALEHLGPIAHVQNVHHSTLARSKAREQGVQPLPKTGYQHPAPAPVGALSQSQIADRRNAIAARKAPKGFFDPL